MTTGLTLQTERENRYEQRCHKKRIDQQNMDRTKRLENRCELRTEIMREVRNEISVLAQKKMNEQLRTINTRGWHK